MTIRSLSIACFLGLALSCAAPLAAAEPANLHQQLLDLAARQQEQRRARFARVKTRADLETLQQSLREKFLHSLGGLPEQKGIPPSKIVGVLEADDHVVEKLVFQSLPGYYVSALLYRPKTVTARLPGVISPCGHSAVGKAANAYQILHINLARRGFVVLTYDPVGQGERSQFWDLHKGKSRYNLACGEHAVLGAPLYLLGANLARYRVWDGIRALDYLASRPEVDSRRLGCVGNSGGGTLTAYIAAVDSRVKAAATCCYITTLPRRMANRIQADPDTDPEQDLFGFVRDGIDHAGLLALRAPRPTLLGTARFDFFPIEGARESFAEAKNLFAAVGAADAVERVEAAEKHGLTLPLRKAVYSFFDRKLAGRNGEVKDEPATPPRDSRDLLVCKDGQVNLTFRSRHLLTLALEEFDRKKKTPRKSLAELLRTRTGEVDFRLEELAAGGKDAPLFVCVNGNEGSGWQEEKDFVQALKKRGGRVVAIDPRGVGKLRSDLRVKGRAYADPLESVEANLAANAFLVGESLVAMRVADVRAALRKVIGKAKGGRVVLCGRRDSALVVCLAAAVEPSITHVAVQETPFSLRTWFDPAGRPMNPARILPGMLRDFGDVSEVLAAVAPRQCLIAAGQGKPLSPSRSLRIVEKPFTTRPADLFDGLGD